MSTQMPYVFDILFYGQEVVLGMYGKSQGTVVRRPGLILPQVNGLGELLFRLAPANASKPIDTEEAKCLQITQILLGDLYGHLSREHMPFGALCSIELSNKHSGQSGKHIVNLNV